MKKKSTSRSAFLNLRVLLGLFVILAGVFLSALGGFGTFSSVLAENGTTREEMAVALAQALNVQIPACVPGQEMFNDVPASSPFCPFIEELVRRGITGGCGGGNYCPNSAVTRAQMAAFLVKVIGSESHTTDTGEANTVTGIGALQSNTTGSFNTANGFQALFSNTSGQQNTATGINALHQNQAGSHNTAIGTNALFKNTVSFNTAIGDSALFSNTTGNENVASGYQALFHNTEGHANTAVGDQALFSNVGTIGGAGNTAIGSHALQDNISGSSSTAVGLNALFSNNNADNTAVGGGALVSATGSGNTALGAFAATQLTAGNNNIFIGNQAGGFFPAVANDVISIGRQAGSAVTGANNVICIGAQVAGQNTNDRCFIGNIYNNVQPAVGIDPDFVTINSSGRLGRSNISSRRYKHDIKPMDKASEVLFALKPVRFRYNKEYDATQTLAFGLIAEEVAEVAPDLGGRNEKGEPESVRYEQVNTMLLNEFLKEHTRGEEQDRKIQEQAETIAQLKKNVDALFARLKEHDSKIQRVTAELD